jgi:hypothetical protein
VQRSVPGQKAEPLGMKYRAEEESVSSSESHQTLL